MSSSEPCPSTQRPRVSPRALLLALALMGPNAYWIIQIERVRQGPYPSILSLYVNVVFILLILVGTNGLVRRLRARWALQPGELATVYTLLALATSLSGMDLVQCLIQMLGHGVYFATPSNRWEQTFLRLFPRRLLIQDREGVVGYYEGHSTFYTAEHLRLWGGPLLIWGTFLTVITGVLLCLSVLFRRRWVEEERLSFPLTRLPLDLVQSSSSLFRNRWMWAGFSLAAGVDILNGLHFLFPVVPKIQVTHFDLSPYLVNPPWNSLGWTPLAFNPMIIGLGYLLPVDLLFSCWFFYLFWKLERIVGALAGWSGVPEFPFVEHQVLGGCLGLVGAFLWLERGYLQQVIQSIRRGEDSGEAMSYRAAGVGVVVGVAGLVAFSIWAGLTWWLATLFFGLYFLMAFLVTRIRAELGPPVHDFYGLGPGRMILRILGSANIAPRDAGLLGLYWWFTSGYQNTPMVNHIEGLKLAQQTHGEPRRLAGVLMIGTVVGIGASAWALLHLGYRLGASAKFFAGTGYGSVLFSELQDLFDHPRPADARANAALLGGLLGVVGLMALRTRFVGLPLHPMGYVLSGNWGMGLIWFPLFLSWLIKRLVLRAGGLRAYRHSQPFFLGLVLGECVIGPAWSWLGIALDVPTYNFWGA